MCPLYVAGLIGPGDRKSVGPMAERVAPGDYDRLHHFVSDGSGTRLRCSVRLRSRRTSWSAARTPSSSSTTRRCRRRWTHSVAVAPQYASALGKTANCQTFARRLVERFEWHYTPKHGPWLDLAESELGVLASQCLDRHQNLRSSRSRARGRKHKPRCGLPRASRRTATTYPATRFAGPDCPAAHASRLIVCASIRSISTSTCAICCKTSGEITALRTRRIRGPGDGEHGCCNRKNRETCSHFGSSANTSPPGPG